MVTPIPSVDPVTRAVLGGVDDVDDVDDDVDIENAAVIGRTVVVAVLFIMEATTTVEMLIRNFLDVINIMVGYG